MCTPPWPAAAEGFTPRPPVLAPFAKSWLRYTHCISFLRIIVVLTVRKSKTLSLRVSVLLIDTYFVMQNRRPHLKLIIA